MFEPLYSMLTTTLNNRVTTLTNGVGEQVRWNLMKAKYIAPTVVLALLAAAIVAGVVGSRRQPLGVKDGRLLPCPDSPNCVSSFAPNSQSGEHDMKPVLYTGTPQRALDAVTQVMAALPRTTLLEKKGNYARFTVRSARVGFIDDVEFLITDTQIQFRSASRLGRSDLGVNRERMTLVSQRLRQRLGEAGV